MRLPRNRLARVLVLLVIAAGVLELVYVVVANVALFAVSKRFADAAPVGVAYDRALTFFPGQARVHNLRLLGSANGGWSVTVAECDVAFDVWQVVSEPRRVKRISADIESIDVGAKGATRRLSGTIHVDAHDVAIEGSLLSFDANATVANAAFASAGETLANELHGTVVFDVHEVDVVKKSLVEAGTGNVTLDGKFLSIAPLASFASLIATQDPGTVHIAGSLKSGVVQPSSELRATTTHATLKDARGASADYPAGLTIVLGVSPTQATELLLAVRTPQIVFGSTDPAHPPDVFDVFELDVSAGDTDLRLNHLEMRSLEWSAEHVRLHEGASTLSAKVLGALQFEMGHATQLVAKGGTIKATDIVREGAAGAVPFDALLTLDRLEISREHGIMLRGRVHPSGKSARPIVELIVSSPSLRRSLAALDAEAFTGDAALRRSEGRLAIDDVTLTCAKMTLRGGYYRSENESRGAFVLADGPLEVGIVSKDATESVVVSPSATWLETQLKAAATIHASP